MIGPTVDVRPYSVEINVRIAAFGHAQESLVHVCERARNVCQLLRDDFRPIVGDGSLRGENGGERKRCLGFDRHVNEHKPLFILTAEEILLHANIAQLNRAVKIKSSPVVQYIGGVG